MLGDGRPEPQGPEPAVTPGMEAQQATLGQFMGTMAEMVERLAQRRDELPGNGPGRQTGNPRVGASEDLEGVRCWLVAESSRRRLVDPKRYDGEGCPW